MEYNIDIIRRSEYPEVLRVWEASVRASHHFLKEEDIQYFKPLILDQYLDAVELRALRKRNGEIVGFMGVAESNLEMLFIHPDHFGKGLGKRLVEYSIEKLDVQKVDVNEQNDKALGFYKHIGFKIVGRSESDGSGKPYPILHMKLDR